AARYRFLTLEEEQELARRWRDAGDERALDKLVGAHLRLALKTARGFRGYGLPLADLVAEANVGLMQAASKFDPDKGFRFATYAQWWIRAAIQEYVLHNWSLVKIGTTAGQKKLFFNLRRLKAQLDEMEGGDLSNETVDAIAGNLDVTRAEVIEMNRRLGSDRSLNARIGEEEDSEWQDLLADERPDQETLVADRQETGIARDWLRDGLDVLNERERRIFEARRLNEDPLTLEELSREYDISRERVRQIEGRAFEKVRKAVLNKARDAQARTADRLAAANQNRIAA
ncbi:MAG TPA: RNA polymerase factor sigma-32, partial [Arenibaculum sp.]|nr:RNA polymerase factor sigma-32 [Arenibaculum sp.]